MLSGKKIREIIGTDHDLKGIFKKTHCFYFESRTENRLFLGFVAFSVLVNCVFPSLKGNYPLKVSAIQPMSKIFRHSVSSFPRFESFSYFR